MPTRYGTSDVASALAWVATLFSVSAGCAGVQTGDGNGPGCSFRTAPLLNLASMPEGFDQTPEQMLSPVAAPVEGALVLASGERVPVTMHFDVKSEGALAVYREDSGSASDCDATGVEAPATVTIDGGEVVFGETEATVRVLNGQVRVRMNGQTLDTSLEPGAAQSDATTLIMPLQMDTTCTWFGAWKWGVPSDCSVSQDVCDGAQHGEEAIGQFTASGDCAQDP